MPAPKCSPKKYQFYFAGLDNLVLVEVGDDDEVVIRTTRNNLSERARCFFIRELAAEGYIDDSYQWISDSGSCPGLRWVVDISWARTSTLLTRRTTRVVSRLLAGAALLWVGMMSLLLFSSTRHAPHAEAPPRITLRFRNRGRPALTHRAGFAPAAH